MMPGGRGSRCAVLVALAGCLLASAGCGGGGAGAAASCADEITVAGTHYIGGQDTGVPRPASAGSELRGATLPCADGNPPVVAVVAHTIPGVEVQDAVLGPYGEVMLAQRWWGRPWSTLPSALQPFVHR
jgi:hypothetical protein